MHLQTEEEIAFFVKLFEEKRLPAKDWTHPAHLVVATYYYNQYGEEMGLNRMRKNIKSFNVFHGGKNTDTEGYHETITVWYMQQVGQVLKKQAKEGTLPEKISAVLNSPLSDTKFVYHFYSKENLLSVEARRTSVLPDKTHYFDY